MSLIYKAAPMQASRSVQKAQAKKKRKKTTTGEPQNSKYLKPPSSGPKFGLNSATSHSRPLHSIFKWHTWKAGFMCLRFWCTIILIVAVNSAAAGHPTQNCDSSSAIVAEADWLRAGWGFFQPAGRFWVTSKNPPQKLLYVFLSLTIPS